jgi:hypothetical protein
MVFSDYYLRALYFFKAVNPPTGFLGICLGPFLNGML